MSTNNVNIKIGELSFNGELGLSKDFSKLVFGNGLGLVGKAKIAVEAVAEDPMSAGEDALMLSVWVAAKLFTSARVRMPELGMKDTLAASFSYHAEKIWYLPVAEILSIGLKKTELQLDTLDGKIYLYFRTPKKADDWRNALKKLCAGKKLGLLEQKFLL